MGKRPFKKDFSRCIYKFQDEQEFSEAWDAMIDKYIFSDNQWLQNLFLEKKKWAFVDGHQVFCGGMYCTQRSKSLKGRVKAYLNSKSEFTAIFSPLLYVG